MVTYSCCIFATYAVVAQSVEHYIGSVEVTGSIPVVSSITKKDRFQKEICPFFYIYNRRLNQTIFGTLLNVLNKSWYTNKYNHVIHQISRTLSVYNWNCVPFNQYVPTSPNTQPLVTTTLLPLSMTSVIILDFCITDIIQNMSFSV